MKKKGLLNKWKVCSCILHVRAKFPTEFRIMWFWVGHLSQLLTKIFTISVLIYLFVSMNHLEFGYVWTTQQKKELYFACICSDVLQIVEATRQIVPSLVWSDFNAIYLTGDPDTLSQRLNRESYPAFFRVTINFKFGQSSLHFRNASTIPVFIQHSEQVWEKHESAFCQPSIWHSVCRGALSH